MSLFTFFLVMTTAVVSLACRVDLDQSYFGNDLEDQPAPFAFRQRLDSIVAIGKKDFPFHIDHLGWEAEEAHKREVETKELIESLVNAGESNSVAVKVATYYLKSRETPGLNLIREFEDKIPLEFKLYRDGVHEMLTAQGPATESVVSWKKLLALPESERKKRTTWTLFMMGAIQTDSSLAIDYLRKVRLAVHDGFSDPLNLGAGTYRIQNQRAESAVSELLGRIGLAYAGHPMGDYEVARIRALTWKTLENLNDLSIADRRDLLDPYNLRVINGVLLNEFGRKNEIRIKSIEKYFEFLQSMRMDSIAGIDELAWGAYTNGYYDLADKWIKKADENVELTWMLKSRLAHRKGQFAIGFDYADKAIEMYQKQNQYSPLIKVNGDLRLLSVAPDLVVYFTGQTAWTAFNLNQYRKAFHYFLMGRHWVDLSFIGERFLTTEELIKEYKDLDSTGTVNIELRIWLSNIIARRLMREGAVEEAIAFFGYKEKPMAEKYLSILRLLKDQKDSESLAHLKFQLAEYLRSNGMELFGLETEPDWRIWDGNFTGPKLSEILKLAKPKSFEYCQNRFHYRYQAAELAMTAAYRSKDSVFQCTALGTAGRWVHLQQPDLGRQIKSKALKLCSKNSKAYQAFVSMWWPPANTNETDRNHEK